jgi:hypothetical protein
MIPLKYLIDEAFKHENKLGDQKKISVEITKKTLLIGKKDELVLE